MGFFFLFCFFWPHVRTRTQVWFAQRKCRDGMEWHFVSFLQLVLSYHSEPGIFSRKSSFKKFPVRDVIGHSSWLQYRALWLPPEAYLAVTPLCRGGNFSAEQINFNLSILLCLLPSTEFGPEGEVISLSVRSSDLWPVTALNFAMETDGIYTHKGRKMKKGADFNAEVHS